MQLFFHDFLRLPIQLQLILTCMCCKVSFLVIFLWICLRGQHGRSGVVDSVECGQRRYSSLSFGEIRILLCWFHNVHVFCNYYAEIIHAIEIALLGLLKRRYQLLMKDGKV